VHASKDETQMTLFAWVVITVLFLALTTSLIQNENEVKSLRAHIELLSQACDQ
jgi:hypothetical protein